MNDTRLSLVIMVCPHCNHEHDQNKMKMKGGAAGVWEDACLFAINKRKGNSGKFTTSLHKNGTTECGNCGERFAWRYTIEPTVVCLTGKIDWTQEEDSNE